MDLAPHFLQTGTGPVLVGDGPDTLACECGQVLVQGTRPGQLVGIAFRCAACSAVTTTPDLAEGERLLGHVVPLARDAAELPSPGVLRAGLRFADRAIVDREEGPLRPQPASRDPVVVSPELLQAVIAAYDEITGGAFAAHAAASQPLHWTGVRRYPLAWSCLHLQAWLAASPRPPLLGPTESTVAAVHVAAFRQFLSVWGAHPLFPQMAGFAAGTGFGLHELAVFATVQTLFAAGNRVGLLMAGPDTRVREWSLQTQDRLLAVETVPFPGFAWPDGKPFSAASLRHAVQAAIAGARGRVNALHPGLLILSAGLVPEQIDAPLVEAMERLCRSAGRMHRGLAGLGMITPRVGVADRPEAYGFGWVFLPVANPAYEGENKVVVPRH